MEMVLGKPDLALQSGNNTLVPMVAVWMVTYNHEKYIREAILSVLMQQCSFSFRLFIGEDCSSDTTRIICEELAKTHPGKIYLVTNERNLGSMLNAMQMYNICFKSGAKYIAMLEGDDYWTDPLKLQKQVDFLEKNPEYTLHGHGVEVRDHNYNLKYIYCNPGTYTRYDILRKNPISTLSIMFRRDCLDLPDWFTQVGTGDFILFLLLTTKGPAFISEELMGVHIDHDNGIWSNRDNKYKIEFVLKNYQLILKHIRLSNRETFFLKKELKKLILDPVRYEDKTFGGLLLGKTPLKTFFWHYTNELKLFLRWKTLLGKLYASIKNS